MSINNIKQDRYLKVLYHAVEHDNARMVRFLLKSGACIKARDRFGNSLLHITARKGSGKIIQCLLKYGCDVNWQNYIGDTALNYAVLFGHKSIVEMLLKMGANSRIKNFKGETCLHYAVKTNNLEVIRIILKYNPCIDDIEDFYYTASQITITKKQETIVNLLTANCKQINKNDHTESIVHLSIKINNKNIVSMLLDAGANINVQDGKGRSVLQYASKLRNIAVVEMLINRGADLNNVDNIGFSALHYSVSDGDEQLVYLLLKYGANIEIKDSNGNTALHIVAMQEKNLVNFRILRALLENKANPNETNDDGKTPFHMSLSKDVEVVNLFLKHGADVKAKDNRGRTALYFAAKNGNKEIMKLILDTKKVSIHDATNIDGATALHIASKFAKIDCIKELINRGANVNCTDFNGDTSIFYVAQWPIRNNIHRNLIEEYQKSAKLLLKKGADINYETILGENLLELSIEKRNTILIKVIVEHLAILEEKLLNISESNIKLLQDNAFLKLHYNFCKKELAEMKKYKIYGTISLFNILEADINVMTGFARNKNLVHAFEGDNYVKNYPIYYDLLFERFYEGVQKQGLIEISFKILSKILQLPDRYNIIYEMILRYMNIDDLKYLVNKSVTV